MVLCSLSDALSAVRDSSGEVQDGVEFAEVAAAHGVPQEEIYSPSIKAVRKPFVQSRGENVWPSTDSYPVLFV